MKASILYKITYLILFLLLSNKSFAQAPVIVPVEGNSKLSEIDRLSKAINYQTVSSIYEKDFRFNEFKSFHLYLEQSFPQVHQSLQKTTINQFSLLYTWPGTNQELKPILITAHLDVVPVSSATEGDWEKDAFRGKIEDGFVWGRGTMDDKYRVMALMESVENLLIQGYQPERTIFLAFGHDEEVGGYNGAAQIAKHLQKDNIRLAAVFDEGLTILKNVLPGVEEPVALVGTAAKGNLNLKLSVSGEGGHSSVPPSETAIGTLSQAISKLSANPFEARMTPTTHATLTLMADKLGGKYQFAMRHYGLFKGKVLKLMAKDRATDALVRTMFSPTIIKAGNKENVLPREAYAILNVRLLQGDNKETVIKHVKQTIDDDRISIEQYGDYTPPSAVTATNTWVYEALHKSIQTTFGINTVVPALFPGATDGRHYASLTDNVLRFAPQVIDRQSAKLVHNANERIAIDVYKQCISFYETLISSIGGNNRLTQHEARILENE